MAAASGFWKRCLISAKVVLCMKAMPSFVHCVRLFADANGDSHFGDIEIGVAEVQYAPPAPTSTKNDGAKLRRLNLNLLFS